MDVAERLLRILEDLPAEQLRAFVFYLGNMPSPIPRGKLSNATQVEVAELLSQHYPGEELNITAQVLRKIPRMDLLERYRLYDEMGRTGGRESLTPGMNASLEAPAAAAACEPQKQRASAGRGDFIRGQPRQVSEKELMMLAGNMGKNWKQIGIQFLGMKTSYLEQIEEENQSSVVMRAFYMLKDWRNRERERATAAQLYVILNQKGVPLDREAYQFLMENA